MKPLGLQLLLGLVTVLLQARGAEGIGIKDLTFIHGRPAVYGDAGPGVDVRDGVDGGGSARCGTLAVDGSPQSRQPTIRFLTPQVEYHF